MGNYLLDQLTEYTSSDAYPLHMPGHKRQIRSFADPFAIDITEIEGFDNLHHAEGILLEAQERAARLYGADETWYLVNGSTCGILAAVSASVKRGGRILMARNCHKAAYHAAFLNGLQVTWLYPEIDMGTGICGSIPSGQVREALEALRQGDMPDPVAVLITSPTYDGVVSDIRAIAREVHRAGAILIVDEAHGAHFAMHPYFPESALSCGADIVVNSLHKTMPSLTQTALLHVKGPRVDRVRLRKYLDIYQSSSPSYVLMAGMDECVRMMETQGRRLFDAFVGRLETLREHLKKMQVLRLMTGAEPELQAFAYDASKIIIIIPEAVAFGPALGRLLREQYHLEPEMEAEHYVTAIMTVADTQEGFDRLEQALLEIDEWLVETARATSEKPCTISGGAVESPTPCTISGGVVESLTPCTISGGAVESPTPCNQRLGKLPCEAWDVQAPQSKIGEYPTQSVGGHPARGIIRRGEYPDEGQIPGNAFAGENGFLAGAASAEVMTMEEADRHPHEPVSLEVCAGRTAAEFVYLYPPGIPLLVPGEQIPDGFSERIRRYREMGLHLQGLADYRAETIQCVVTG